MKGLVGFHGEFFSNSRIGIDHGKASGSGQNLRNFLSSRLGNIELTDRKGTRSQPKSFDKQVTEILGKRFTDSNAPSAQAPTWVNDSKRSTSDNAPTGSLDAPSSTNSVSVLAPKGESSSGSSRSECASFLLAEPF
jgi:hypothetical protein